MQTSSQEILLLRAGDHTENPWAKDLGALPQAIPQPWLGAGTLELGVTRVELLVKVLWDSVPDAGLAPRLLRYWERKDRDS